MYHLYFHCRIFLFLGMALIKQNKEGAGYWHTGFVVWSIAFCLICRFFSVYGLTWIANKYRVKIINLQEQFIMAYGGLRGAVGFSLVEMISKNDVSDGTRRLFVTTTLVVVTFTIFFQVSSNQGYMHRPSTIYRSQGILYLSQTFCLTPKDDFNSVNSFL